MITFAYVAKEKNCDFENHLRQSSGMISCEIIYCKEPSFAKAYNTVLKKAKFDTICFIREDIVIQSKNWGKKFLDQFIKSDFAVVGIVGSIIVPMSGLVWEKEEPLVGRIWYETFEPRNEHRFSEVFPSKIIEVVTVDDAFFFVNRTRLKAKYDKTYKDDSFYELDFFLANYERGCKVGVTFDIKVLKTGYNPHDKSWYANQKMFVTKHKNLPFRLKPKIMVSDQPIKMERMPKVSIVISTKGKPVELASCLESIYAKTLYKNYEIIIVDQGSEPDEIKSIIEYIKGYSNTRFIELINEHKPSVVEQILEEHISEDTELLLFCDPEVILLNDAISRMVKAYVDDPNACGTLGIRMHTRNNMIRHFGLQLFSTETKEGFELGLGFQGYQSAYRYKNKVVKNVLGASKDFLMISKDLFKEVGGFNKSYMHSLEDFELNIKTILKGKKNLIVGNAVCYYLGQDVPKFMPDDFTHLVNFINQHVDTITPYVDLLYAA